MHEQQLRLHAEFDAMDFLCHLQTADTKAASRSRRSQGQSPVGSSLSVATGGHGTPLCDRDTSMSLSLNVAVMILPPWSQT